MNDERVFQSLVYTIGINDRFTIESRKSFLVNRLLMRDVLKKQTQGVYSMRNMKSGFRL